MNILIPCPNGHRLRVPEERLGRVAKCPKCETKFRLVDPQKSSPSSESSATKSPQKVKRSSLKAKPSETSLKPAQALLRTHRWPLVALSAGLLVGLAVKFIPNMADGPSGNQSAPSEAYPMVQLITGREMDAEVMLARADASLNAARPSTVSELAIEAAVSDVRVDCHGDWIALGYHDKGRIEIVDVKSRCRLGKVNTDDRDFVFCVAPERLVYWMPSKQQMVEVELPTFKVTRSIELNCRIHALWFDSRMTDDRTLFAQCTVDDRTTFAIIDLQTSSVHAASHAPGLRRGSARDTLVTQRGLLVLQQDLEKKSATGYWSQYSDQDSVSDVNYCSVSSNGETLYTDRGVFDLTRQQIAEYSNVEGRLFLASASGARFLGVPGFASGHTETTAFVFDEVGKGPSSEVIGVDLQKIFQASAAGQGDDLPFEKRVLFPDKHDVVVTMDVENQRMRFYDTVQSPKNPAIASATEDDFSKAVATGKQVSALVVLPYQRGFGSAVCFHPDGYFATNYHVIEAAKYRKVSLVLRSGTADEKTISAKLVGSDKTADLAILKAVDQSIRFDQVRFAEVGDISAGQTVVALGFPLGDALTISDQTYPEISVNKSEITNVAVDVFGHRTIEFSTQLNPGNSGGPVLNQSGNLVGIVQAVVTNANLSFCIPLSDLVKLIDKLKIKPSL